MSWIIYSFIYAIFNAIYITYNTKYHYNGYFLGIIRGFGISLLTFPFIFFIDVNLSFTQLILLILQGWLIGFYDSHIFFASSRYGTYSTSGFMATSVIVTLILWWIIEFKDLKLLLEDKIKFISLLFIMSGITISYWQMMNVNITSKAEKYLYPAVFALSFMSILTRYIALNSGSVLNGVIYYLIISCFVSGVYNVIMYYSKRLKFKKSNVNKRKINILSLIWLVVFSAVLITAKTIALRVAYNPSYVVALLLTSPILLDIFRHKKFRLNDNGVIFLTFIFLLILFSLH